MSDEPVNGNGTNGNGKASAVFSTIVQTVTVVALFIAGFWAGIIEPIQNRVSDVEKNTITRAEHAEYRLGVDRQLEKDYNELLALQNAQVPRNEHIQHWETDAAETARLQKEIETLQNQLGNSYTLGDQIRHLQQELDEIRKDARTDAAKSH